MRLGARMHNVKWHASRRGRAWHKEASFPANVSCEAANERLQARWTCHARQQMNACRQGGESARVQKKPIRVDRMATVNMIAAPGALIVIDGERGCPRLPTCHARQEMSACRQGSEGARMQKTVAARPTGQEGHARRRRAHALTSRVHQARRGRQARSRPGRGTDEGDKFKVDIHIDRVRRSGIEI